MIRTFNYWFIAAPAFLLISILLAFFSTTEESGRVRRRGSDRLWQIGIILYACITGGVIALLLNLESIVGMVDFWGGYTWKYVEGFSRITLCIAAAAWSALTYFAFVAVRKRRFKHIDYACKHGYSKRDRERRRRACEKSRREAKLSKQRQRLVESGKLRLIRPDSSSVDQDAAQQRIIEEHVQRLRKQYRIELKNDLGYTYQDGDGKHFISDYLPDGVHEFYVAINLKNEESTPLFLGHENAEDNLIHYLTDKVKARICDKAAQPAINQ